MKTVLMIMIVVLMVVPAFAQEWNVVANPDANMYDLYSITVTPNGTVHAVGANGTYMINSGGGFVLQVHPANHVADIKKIFFLDNNNGYILAGIAIVKTNTGGTNWAIQFLTTNNLYDIDFWNADSGIAVGGSDLILKTVDGGVSWTQIGRNMTTDNIVGVTWITENIVLAIADNNTLLTSTNSGDDWTSQSLPYTTLFTDIAYNNSYVTISGNGSVVLKSMDYGVSWTQMNFSSTLINITAIALSSTGYASIAVSQNGNIYQSTNDCLDWTQISNGTTNWLNSIITLSNGSGWIVGDDGVILFNQQIPISIEIINTQTPNEYKLTQNYPNPFNPTTNIEYSIPTSGIVTITVHNILGQEVANLVNEFQQAGTYRITWNGSNLSSGIYFYRIQTEQYIESRKMLLLK